MSLSNYQEISRIYEGVNVRVSRARNISSDFPVVLKQQLCSSLFEANRSIAEAMNQARLNHYAICKVYECFLQQADNGGFLSVIVEEEMEGDLNTEIQRRKVDSEYWIEYELVFHLADLSAACAYAQANGIAHRDIKPQNVFMSQGRLKLGDFGSSAQKYAASMHQTLQGTPFYLSPELKQKLIKLTGSGVNDYTEYDAYQSDVYSLGVMMVFMAYLSPPSWFASIAELQRNTENMLQEFANMSTLQYILSQMLQIDPNQRPTFAQISEYCNQYIQSFQWQPQYLPTLEGTSISEDSTETTNSYTDHSCTEIPKCQYCGNGMKYNWSSTAEIEDDLKCFSSMFTEVCSKECLRDLCAREYTADCCMNDFKHLEGNEVIRLKCGHGFCVQRCLVYFLKKPNVSKTPQMQFKCRVCQCTIEENDIACFFQSAIQMKRLINANLSADYCEKCCAKPHEKVLICKHKLCIGCLKIANRKKGDILAICSVCGVSSPYQK